MKFFNSLQVVAIFAAFPFGLSWLDHAAFSGHFALYCIGWVVYACLLVLMVAAVYTAVCEWEGKA